MSLNPKVELGLRITDILVSLMSILPATILCVVAAIFISLESKGAPLIFQTRVGRHQNAFKLWKLRTMYLDTEQVATHHAPAHQVTRVGRFLRRFKIDELPQIVNVLKGEMSFVGPRPCLFNQTSVIEAREKEAVYELRPGVSGFSQVAGITMEQPEELASMDAKYFEHYNLKTYFEVIFKTIIGPVFKSAR